MTFLCRVRCCCGCHCAALRYETFMHVTSRGQSHAAVLHTAAFAAHWYLVRSSLWHTLV